MQNTIKSLVVTTLALLTLSLSAVAEPQTQGATQPVGQPVTTVIETLQVRENPRQPLITQEDVKEQSVKARGEVPNRPRGESRSDRDERSGDVEKPILEVHGF